MVVENRIGKSSPDLKATVFEHSCIECCSSSLKDDLEEDPHKKTDCFLDYLVFFSLQ